MGDVPKVKTSNFGGFEQNKESNLLRSSCPLDLIRPSYLWHLCYTVTPVIPITQELLICRAVLMDPCAPDLTHR